MGYFPFFMDIAGKRGVIIGGGKKALDKVKKLLPFGAELVVIAPQMDEKMKELAGENTQNADYSRLAAQDSCKAVSLTLLERDWTEADLEGAAFVIAALPDAVENARIAVYCRERHILVNAVDQPGECSFYFPGIVKDGPVTVAVSSDGKSPAATLFLRKKVESVMPEGIGCAVELLGQLRPELMESVTDFSRRAKIQEQLLSFILENVGVVTLEVLRERMYTLAAKEEQWKM